MKMQFKITSEAQSREVQEALFAAGYKWEYGGKTVKEYGAPIYLATDYFENGCITWCSSEHDSRYPFHVVVDGKVYKEGEEPKPKFKVGDKVLCMETSLFGTLKKGETYTVEEVDSQSKQVRLTGIDMSWYVNRFELAPAEQVIVVDELVDDLQIRPPLGLRPKHIADLDKLELDQNRLIEVLEAMLRYAQAHKAIPDAWDNEYDDLRENLNAYYEPEPFYF